VPYGAHASARTQVESEAHTAFVWDGDLLTQEVQDDKTTTLYEPDSFVPLARIEILLNRADCS